MRPSIGTRSAQYLIVFIFTVICVYPLILMVLSSFKSNLDIFQHPFALPTSFHLETYRQLLGDMPFFHYFLNSVIVSCASVLMILVFASLAAFYLARFTFKWTGTVFFLFLIGMMIPIKLGIVPLFLLMKHLHLLDSLWSLIFMYTAIGMPLSILILTGFFKTLPLELEESARIDGSGNLGILWHVLLPLMRPALGTVMIINFIEAWNDFFFPLIFIQDEMKKTIPVGMLSLFGEYSANWSVLFAGLTLSSIPMLVLFFLASRQFMDGMTQGALK
ncbi:carbohydrate ABC transporter permease [Camelliibacillus cellulosilyticus]|uniref:Carbohydrate ABC transporter permease n=1 Tax=Camelliibacillus cellulosilyticus TaxID=2174486 RepID=A0ABV9GNP6_9BACL